MYRIERTERGLHHIEASTRIWVGYQISQFKRVDDDVGGDGGRGMKVDWGDCRCCYCKVELRASTNQKIPIAP